jgi:hypothetical protein
VVAGAAHALLFAVLPRSSAPPPPQPAREQTEAELDILYQPAASNERPSDDGARSDLRASSASLTGPRPMRGNEVAASAGAAEPSAVAEGAAASAPAPSASAEGDGWTFDAKAPADVAALIGPGAIAQATRGIGTAELERHGPWTTGGLLEGLDAHDVSVGMGRGGPVLTALENALASDGAPFEGAATFDVGIDSGGHVSVVIVDESVASTGWSHVADAARAAIDPAMVRIPPGARGWHVVARIDAQVRYPNGADPKTLGTQVEASPGAVHVTKDAIVVEKMPAVAFVTRGKVCSLRVEIGLTLVPISGGCDPANIGTQPLRVVHGHVVSEGRL